MHTVLDLAACANSAGKHCSTARQLARNWWLLQRKQPVLARALVRSFVQLRREEPQRMRNLIPSHV